jgi:hypothetical protein
MAIGARAQTGAAPEPAQESTRLEQVPRVPGMGTLFRGLNAGVTFSAVHDSSIGWYNLVTPAIGYTFSQHYSVDASLSIYPYRLVQNQATTAPATQQFVAIHGDLSDTLLGFHAYFDPHAFQNTITASMTAPTGNRDDGLGTGRVTFDLRDHVERYVGQTGFILDLGGGDSSGLFNRLVTNEYSSLGPIAHFQTGLIYWFPGRNYIQSVAYEQLPLGDQKIYTTLSAPGKPTETVVSGRGVSEDNGFTTSVGLPITSRITLSGYYNRSLRLHLDTVSMGLTFVLRGTGHKRGISMIDRAIREAERATP